MSFNKYTDNGTRIRNAVQFIPNKNEKILVEQSHQAEVNINNIVKKHGVELIAKTAALQNFVYDDNPDNDFQEVMNIIHLAKQSFYQIPSSIRKQFDNNPAKFVDFVRNPDNIEQLQTMGLAKVPDNPPSEVTKPETPAPETPKEV